MIPSSIAVCGTPGWKIGEHLQSVYNNEQSTSRCNTIPSQNLCHDGVHVWKIRTIGKRGKSIVSNDGINFRLCLSLHILFAERCVHREVLVVILLHPYLD